MQFKVKNKLLQTSLGENNFFNYLNCIYTNMKAVAQLVEQWASKV